MSTRNVQGAPWWRFCRRLWRRVKPWLFRILGSGVVVAVIVVGYMLYMSATGPLASASVHRSVSLASFPISGTKVPSAAPAGPDADLTLLLIGSRSEIIVAATHTLRAHADPALDIQAICGLSVHSYSDHLIFGASESQEIIYDEQTGVAYLVGQPQVGEVSDNFWQLDFAAYPRVTTRPDQSEYDLTLTAQATRFGKGGIPLGSFEITLTMTVSYEGISCRVFAPTTSLILPPVEMILR